MNQQAKSAIKSLVLGLRHKLEDDIAIRLKRYGFSGERWLPLERLPHIEQDNQAAIERFRLDAALEQHLRRIGADPEDPAPKQRSEAVNWFVREVAFTHLNRLVALKVLEMRGLIEEIITTRDTFGGRSHAHRDYRNAHPEEARQPDGALPDAIRHICRQVYAEFRFIFDVGDPATDREPPPNTILWPSYPVLRESIALINGLDEVAENTGQTLWAEDEILGWLYQFYNAEHKEAVRDRGRPRRPAEVAVINQFFTPRWIVKFLVDNTLGRLWLEMHPDSERVRAKCDYLVPEPLSADNVQSEVGNPKFQLDPDSPINNPHAPSRRETKPVTEIRLIDPACGTMHFGHYAFEVFQEMYLDTLNHDWPIFLSSSDKGEWPGVRAGDGSIPTAILRHNIYGVDIDLRAVQLAGLSLFIKAKSANPDAHISHLNLVVADAVLPADGARKQFLDQYADDKVVQGAVRQVLTEMENVAEVGSLLRVEERLRDILGKAGHAAVKSWQDDKQRELPGFEPTIHQLSLAEAPHANAEQWGAHYTITRLLEDLRIFANRALETHDLNAQLFAREAEKTVHLLDVFLNDYDVVVMNPPYGGTTTSAKKYLRSAYPGTRNDLYAAFFERALELSASHGYIGALTSRSFLYLTRFRELREDILLKRTVPTAVLDLGFGILDDAFVETAASVIREGGVKSSRQRSSCSFIRVTTAEERRQQDLENALTELRNSRAVDFIFNVDPLEFGFLPRAPFAYWSSSSLRRRFNELQPFDPTYGIVRQGKATGDDERFLRQRWEIPQEQLGKRWQFFAKGGAYCKYYYDVDILIDWSPEAQTLHAQMGNALPNQQHYFGEGLTYPLVTVKGLNVRYLKPECVFGHKGPLILTTSDWDLWNALGVFNSELLQAFVLMLTPSRSFEVGYVGAVPFVESSQTQGPSLGKCAMQAHDLKATWDTGNETCISFDAPWLIQSHQDTLLADTSNDLNLPNLPDSHSTNLPTLLDYVRTVETAADTHLQQIQSQIDETVYDLYEISESDRALIERELGDRPPELVWPQMERKSDKEKRREHVRRLISYFLLQALKEKRDGIIPLNTGTGQTTALEAVRSGLESTFGEEAAFKMESEIKQVLGRDIADWLDGPFIKWHTKLYKKRPIIWQVSSGDYYHTFNCFIYYHALDADTLRKVQTLYLWPLRRAIQSELETARQDQQEGLTGASSRIEDAEKSLVTLEEFETKLLTVIKADVVYKPPKWAEGPFRGGIYDPVIDDGVKINIMPLQKARILRYKKLV